MQTQSIRLVKTLVGPLLLLVLVLVGWQTRDAWMEWIIPAQARDEDKKEHKHANADRVTLTLQAQRNLNLNVVPIALSTHRRKIYLPGTVVDKPGRSDRGIPAPIAGVVISVYAVPGKTVRVGEELFRLRIASESFQTSQMELYKSIRELAIAQKELKRLGNLPAGSVPETRLLEIEYQQDRFKVLIDAYRQDLRLRQLTDEQIAGIEKGTLVTEVVIKMPARLGKDLTPESAKAPAEFEVQELKVSLGDHVQAGQMMAYLADHRNLYIEGRALRQEARLLTQAAKEGWPVEAEFTDDDDASPGERLDQLTIEFLGNTMDASGLTLPVYVPFVNPHKDYVRNGRTYRTDMYRPGQRVLLKVTVGEMPKVFTVPHAAVVQEGAEAYVFRQNGPTAFDRRPVHVLLEDSDEIVLANDRSIAVGDLIALNGAAALNRALKASQAGESGGHHHHD